MSVQTTYETNFTAGLPGMPADASEPESYAYLNQEASAEIAFGQAVCFGSLDQAALSPDAGADKIIGIVMRSHAYPVPEGLGDTGIKPGYMMRVAHKGRMYVTCEGGCTRGDRLYIRHTGGTEGALRASADSSNTTDSTNQGRWLTSAADGALAVLEFDFTVSPTVA